MGIKCCVESCQLKANSWNIQLYKFPLNSTLYNKWVAAIKKYDQFEPCRNLRICSRHFKLQDREKSSFKLKLGTIPSVFVRDQRSINKVIFTYIENIKNYSTSAEENISKKTLELLVHYGVFTDEDLEARLKREKYWDAYLDECAIKSLSEICNDTNQLDKHISSAKAFAIKMKSTIENEYSLEELILTHLLKLISHFTEKNLLKCWIH
ncbi:hypothetical protein QTP88_006204 [Uroleucon formosanum]